MYQIADEEKYTDGQIIFEEGSSGDWVYVVASGAVEISQKIDGRKIVIEVLQAGEIFGELGFIAKAPRMATARAVGDTLLELVDRNFLDEELNRLSGDFRNILLSLVKRFQKLSEKANFGRQAPRLTTVLNVVFKDKQRFVSAYTENVSGRGMFIKTAMPLEKGAQFMLKLNLPGESEPVKIQCQVAWSRTWTDDPQRLPLGMGGQIHPAVAGGRGAAAAGFEIMTVVDLRSDTITQPTPAMRRAMAEADVGDDVFGEDPTVNRLEQMAAERLGKEAGLFVASGTMANLVCQMTHCGRGNEIILGDQAHVFHYEQGGSAAVGGIHPRTVPNLPDGRLALEDIEAAIRPDNLHFPRTRLIVLENTHNRCNGSPPGRRLHGVCRCLGGAIRPDGARGRRAAFQCRRSTGDGTAEAVGGGRFGVRVFEQRPGRPGGLGGLWKP